jgi:signal transduction histidine kinase/CHASE1-domain containing sensor protein/CheY-like chemotaxis protein
MQNTTQQTTLCDPASGCNPQRRCAHRLSRIFRSIGRHAAWWAIGLLVLGLVVTGVAARLTQSTLEADARQQFEFDCQVVKIQISERLHDHEQILRSAAAFFADTDGVTRDEWREFSARQKISQILPGIQGLGFALQMAGPQLEEHIRSVRAEGFPDYRVWPEGERETYTSIVFLEPFSGRNLRAFGYDMLSEPVRRAAMEQARDQDAAILTTKVTLVQETSTQIQAGTLMYVPVYQMNAPIATVAERRSALMGWVYSPYRMNDLMDGILHQPSSFSPHCSILLKIFDGVTAETETLLYDSDRDTSSLTQSLTPMKWETTLKAAGRQWLLGFTKAGGMKSGMHYSKASGVLAAGGTISLLLAGLVFSLANTRQKALNKAEHLAADLHQTDTERNHIAFELEKLSRIQRALLELATRFVNIPLGQQNAAIDESLATMNQLIAADRAYLLAYDFTAGSLSITHEWCAPGIPSQIDKLQSVPMAPVQKWIDMHRRGESVHVPNVADLPLDDPLRHLLDVMEVLSLITLPLMHDETCLGAISFNAIQKPRIWHDDEISLLRALAEIHTHFKIRGRMEQRAMTLQTSLAKASDAAQAATAAKSLFLANMSHEIRTPLNSILGYAQIMERECASCPSKARLKPITRSGEHLLTLTRNLLDLARNEGQQISITPETFDFYQAIDDVRLMFARHMMTSGLTFEVTRASDVPQFLHADATKIRQILVNLVGNAIKFTTQGSIRVTTSLLTANEPGGTMHLAMDIKDTGCGISQDELDSIFLVFKQAAHGQKSRLGTGLGLPLSRRYAQALGGDVTATSQPGVGSHFHFTFSAQAAPEGMAAPPLPNQVLHLAPDQPTCRVLVVDDDPESRSMLSAMLTNVGFTMETADSAASAWHRLSQPAPINLILIDKHMPEMDGYEAIRHIRELSDSPPLPVLVVTASGFANELDLALAAGADGFIGKPVKRESLLAEIARVTAIRYEYETALPAVIDPEPPEPAALACLTAQQFRLFDQALLRGDVSLLHQLIETIAVDHASLAGGIRLLVEAYEYEQLHRLLDSARKTSA